MQGSAELLEVSVSVHVQYLGSHMPHLTDTGYSLTHHEHSPVAMPPMSMTAPHDVMTTIGRRFLQG